jgi:glycosyltransferase involved in cell wall biosynthesis
VKELGLTEHVRFPGYVGDDDLVELYRHATAFVFPSQFEGFGLPPLWAMACGTPVVASTGGAIPRSWATPRCWSSRATRSSSPTRSAAC